LPTKRTAFGRELREWRLSLITDLERPPDAVNEKLCRRPPAAGTLTRKSVANWLQRRLHLTVTRRPVSRVETTRKRRVDVTIVTTE